MSNLTVLEKMNDIRYIQTPYGLLPSVTSILGATKPPYAQRALSIWKENNPQAETNVQEAIARGTLVHHEIQYILDKKCIPNDLHPLTRIATELLMSKDLVALATEKTLFDTNYGFGGTLDAVCWYKDDFVLFDWKTVSANGALAKAGSRRKSRLVDYKQQITAYRYLWNQNNIALYISSAYIVLLIEGHTEPELIKLDCEELTKQEELFFSRLTQFKSLYGYEF